MLVSEKSKPPYDGRPLTGGSGQIDLVEADLAATELDRRGHLDPDPAHHVLKRQDISP